MLSAVYSKVARVVLGLFFSLDTAAAERSAALPEEARQFDFWLGSWNVNLRVHQEGLEWQDTYSAVANIYPILSGKAVLELWDEKRIKGFSLRYFDTQQRKWILWLNWPGANRSGSSSLAGEFRHGRGEFFSFDKMEDGSEMISRYAFSDITNHSLRWDDAFSKDGGKNWTHNWIMEFSRASERVALPEKGGTAHTFITGNRCDLQQFRHYEFLVGLRTGTVEAGGSGSVQMTGYRVLDGCAVLVFLGASGGAEHASEFAHLTWNTHLEQYELLALSADPEKAAEVFYGTHADGELTLNLKDAPGSPERLRISKATGGEVVWQRERQADDGWQVIWLGRFAVEE